MTDALKTNNQSETPKQKQPKVGLLKLLGDFGSYLFNKKKDVSSLSHDLIELEAERARERAAELLQRKESETEAKLNRKAKLAGEFKLFSSKRISDEMLEHDDHLKHLETLPDKTANSVTKIVSGPVLNDDQSIKSVPVAPKAIIVDKSKDVPIKPPVNPAVKMPMPKVVPVLKSDVPMPKPMPKTDLPTAPKVVAPAPVVTTPKPMSTVAPQSKNDLVAKKHKAAKQLFDERLKHAKNILKNQIENRHWNPYRLVQVNLIKEQKAMFFNWKSKFLSLTFNVILVLLITALAYGYLLVYEREKNRGNELVYKGTLDLVAKIEEKKAEMQATALPLNDRLKFVAYMLDNHIYWTNFFKFLENETLISVYYPEGISAGLGGNSQLSDGTMELTAIAENFSAMSNQSRVFTRSMVVSNVEIINQEKLISASTSLSFAGETGSEAETDAGASSTTTVKIIQLPKNTADAMKFKYKFKVNPEIFLIKDGLVPGTVSGPMPGGVELGQVNPVASEPVPAVPSTPVPAPANNAKDELDELEGF